MAGRMAGQTISDRLLAAKHSLAGQGLAKSACKATTEELIAPKKKHLDYLVHCTNEPNVSIPQLANLLIERSQNTNWVVVYKALITVHHMMCYGNERFTQYLASSNCTFHLSNFLDKGGVQGYDMSPFIRRYARYMNEKAMSYRTVAFDFCKVKRGKEDGMLRTMNADKLLKTLPVLQNQVDALLEFDCSSSDFTNGVINMSFMLLFRDLIKLFACYNDGIINLLEKYFDMNKKQCKEALEIYKRFLIRMDRVGEFLKVAENVGINKGDIPDLTKAPSSLLDALEQHLAHLDGKKGSTQSSAASQSTKNRTNVISGVSALSSTSTSFGSAMANDTTFSTIDEDLKLQVLAEEEAAMNQFKSKVAFHPTPAASAANNPFLDQPLPQESRPSALEIDLLDTEISHMPSSQPFSNHTRVSDDMLQLSNPFSPSAMQSNPLNGGAVPFVLQTNNAWLPNGNVQPSTPTSAFVSENNFAKVFGSAGSAELNSSPFDSLGTVLQPLSSSERNNPQSYNNSNNNNINGTNAVNGNTHQNDAKLLTGDLESSLASLVDNLTINPRPVPVKGVQWNSPRRGSKPNNNWTPQPLSATTGAGYKPMNQGLVSPVTNTPPPIYPQMGYRPFAMSMSPTAIPQMSPFGSMSNNPAQMGQQSLLFH